MKIENIRLLGKGLPMTLVEIVTDDGVVGIGGTEAPLDAVRPILEQRPWQLVNLLLQQDPRDVQRLSMAMFRATLGQGGLVVHAMAALDMALWDLCGKILHVPLYKLFGGSVQEHVMVYASATALDVRDGLLPPLRFKPTERLVAEARARIREGFKAIKFGWGNRFEPEDEERLAAIREAIGPDTRLMIDIGGPDYFHPGVTPKSAEGIARILEKYDVYFLEEPLPPFDFDGYHVLTRATRVRIATGEMLCHGYEFDRLIDNRAVDVIQPDAYRIGVTQALRVSRRADEAGILCVPHGPWSALAVGAHVNVVATVDAGVMIEYPSPSLYDDTVRHGEVVRLNTGDIVNHPLRPEGGYIPLPVFPGLGVGGFNPQAIDKIGSLAAEGLER